MRQRLSHKHQRPHADVGLEIGRAYLVSTAIQTNKKYQVEHAIEHKARAQKHEVGVHAHGVILAGLKLG